MLKFIHEDYEYYIDRENQIFQISRSDNNDKLIDFIRFVGGYDYEIEIYDVIDPEYWDRGTIDKSISIPKTSPVYQIIKYLVGLRIECDYPDYYGEQFQKEIVITETANGICFRLYSKSTEEDVCRRSIIHLKNIMTDYRSKADHTNPETKKRIANFLEKSQILINIIKNYRIRLLMI